MDRTAVAKLISETIAQDDYGVQQVTTSSEKTIYCQLNSVSMSEWFEGGRAGLNPEFRITMDANDYANEKLIKLNGVEYTIYRTYLARNGQVELYVERRGGNG